MATASYGRVSERRKTQLKWLALVLFVFAAALTARQTFMQALGRTFVNMEFAAIWSADENEALDNNNFPGALVVDWVNRNLSDDDKVLVYRQAEFAYYVDNNWVYDFDPKIIDLYETAETKAAAFDYLKSLGITHIFVPNYMPATLYNTPVARVIGDPTYSRELYVHSAMRIYELYETPQDWQCVPQPQTQNWAQGIIGARTTFETAGGLFEPELDTANLQTFTIFEDEMSLRNGRITEPFGAGALDDGTLILAWTENMLDRIGLLSGYGPLHLAPATQIDPNAIDNVKMTFDVEGEGFLEIWLYEYDRLGAVSSRRIWDAILSPDKGTLNVEAQASFLSTTRSYRILVMNGGTASGYASVFGLDLCGFKTGTALRIDSPPVEGFERFMAFDFKPRLDRDIDQDGGTIMIGTDCHELDWFCRKIDLASPGSRLLMRDGGSDDSLQTRMPIASGFTVTTGELHTGFRTLFQCRLGRSKWYLERSPARDGFFEHYIMRFQKHFQPAGNDADDRMARLSMDFQAAPNTIVDAAMLWIDADGKENCYFLGEQVIEDGQDDLTWTFPIPVDASGFTYAFSASHGLKTYINIDVRNARLDAAPEGSGLLPPIRRLRDSGT
ncbi:hypothetical protein ACFFUB_11490 [Algimonas porphyrae]|nr:hypothetical protein [Algimonas porphyrae]